MYLLINYTYTYKLFILFIVEPNDENDVLFYIAEIWMWLLLFWGVPINSN